MPRKLPDRCPDAPLGALEACRKWVSSTYSISLVTPLFGGGPTTLENDPVTFIRGPSVRGQLRFWWRATRGASLESVQQLRKREGEIWGTTEHPSPVTIQVNRVCDVKSTPIMNGPDFRYVLFPYLDEAKRVAGAREVSQSQAQIAQTTTFELAVQWPVGLDIGLDVQAAVWAWANFGGLGARTRRGCGSLFCAELAPSSNDIGDIQAWLSKRLEYYGIDLPHEPRPWPTLSSQLLVLYGAKGPLLAGSIKAWAEAIRPLSKFRQGPGIGRASGRGGRPGTSFWPEADSLRRITEAQGTPAPAGHNAFPRAEFGLPIIFRFRGSPRRDGIPGRPSAEQGGCDLLPAEGGGRLASPLILKALAVGPNQATPMILRLSTPPLKGVRVRLPGGGSQGPAFGEEAIRGTRMCSFPPMKGRSQGGSAVEAFVNFAREEGFR